jgi:hypothetical protein
MGCHCGYVGGTSGCTQDKLTTSGNAQGRQNRVESRCGAVSLGRTYNWVATTDKPIDRIIGIYSGRKDNAPAEAQIGMVWHVDYIDEIIDHHITDR